jgi:diaminohydroxyphosphoribosylaminopyrimidine deaminase/5-amino-6-(5-phosphoribosylamino)uracil reductase
MSDIGYMRLCLELAYQGRYLSLPNPMVGCVIVKDNMIVGQGFHECSGEPHAEIHALTAAGTQAHGASLYTNLEPCCHHGRTPPCVDAIIKAGIKKVIIAIEDPNPLVSGQGIATLQAANIEVTLGILAEEALHLNRAFFHFITTRKPYVIAKWAMSLDGQIATPDTNERQLSNSLSQQDAHELRQTSQAILIGSHTARLDNPSLTVRYIAPIARQPQRIVLNTQADLDATLKLFNGALPDKTWLVCAEEFFKSAQKKFSTTTTEIIPLPLHNNKIDLIALLNLLGQREIISLLVEGGRATLQEFFSLKVVQEITCYLTPWFIGNLPQKISLKPLNSKTLGTDIKIKSYL